MAVRFSAQRGMPLRPWWPCYGAHGETLAYVTSVRTTDAARDAQRWAEAGYRVLHSAHHDGLITVVAGADQPLVFCPPRRPVTT